MRPRASCTECVKTSATVPIQEVADRLAWPKGAAGVPGPWPACRLVFTRDLQKMKIFDEAYSHNSVGRALPSSMLLRLVDA
jgi:hypothetical protein